jgi:hypothetical protein
MKPVILMKQTPISTVNSYLVEIDVLQPTANLRRNHKDAGVLLHATARCFGSEDGCILVSPIKLPAVMHTHVALDILGCPAVVHPNLHSAGLDEAKAVLGFILGDQHARVVELAPDQRGLREGAVPVSVPLAAVVDEGGGGDGFRAVGHLDVHGGWVKIRGCFIVDFKNQAFYVQLKLIHGCKYICPEIC